MQCDYNELKMNVLLVEPEYTQAKRTKHEAKLCPVGLYKHYFFHVSKGDRVCLVKGCVTPEIEPDMIKITSLFTYWSKDVFKAIEFYSKMYPDVIIKVGGIFASLMPEVIRESNSNVVVHPGIDKEVEFVSIDWKHLKRKIQILHASRGCIRHCKFCLSQNTKILMADLSIKNLQDINIGDCIIGISESRNSRFGELRHKITKATVTNKVDRNIPAYKITLVNGNSVICSGDHRWLTAQRGWKYTVNTIKGTVDRSHLTKNNNIKFLGYFNEFTENERFKRGYISGMFYGDGSIRIKKDNRERYKDSQEIRLALTDIEALNRTKDYLKYFGIKNLRERLFYKAKKSTHRNSYCIYSHRFDNFKKVKELIVLKNEKEFMRGFVSGFFDAEGCYSGTIIRIANTNKSLIEYCTKCLIKFGFNPVIEHYKPCATIRITERQLDFFNIFMPAISRKRNNIFNRYLTSSMQIKSIELIGKRKLVDITTTTKNFIANGLVSHNCGVRKIEPRITYKTWEQLKKEIQLNDVVFFDNNFLMNPNHKDILEGIAEHKVNGKVIRCEAQSGFDPRLLTQEDAVLLKKARFKSIRISWDHDIKQGKIVKKALSYLIRAGFNSKSMGVFMIYNWAYPFSLLEQKRKVCFDWNVQIFDCRYRPLDQLYDNYNPHTKNQTSRDYYIHPAWTDKEVRQFRRNVRRQNIMIRFNFRTQKQMDAWVNSKRKTGKLLNRKVTL